MHDLQTIRSQALAVVAAWGHHMSPQYLLADAQKVALWIETGYLPESAYDRERREIGVKVREMAVQPVVDQVKVDFAQEAEEPKPPEPHNFSLLYEVAKKPEEPF